MRCLTENKMENLTPKIDDALDAVIEFLNLEKLKNKKPQEDMYVTEWGRKTKLGVKLSIIAKLREYGVVLHEENL